MTKKRIITISVIASIIVLVCVLFGAVFCLRRQKVVFVDKNTNLGVTAKDLINAGNLKYGSSIFSINKEKAISNIEKQYPLVKVVQIKTTSVIDIEIRVRKRHHTFVSTVNNINYFLDEELKVLEISENEYSQDLIKIPNKYLNINSNTVAGDFVGKSSVNKITYNLITSMLKTVKIDEDVYCEREDILNIIDSVSFDKGYLATGEDSYNRLIIKTKAGLVVDIGKPEKDITRKINACFVMFFTELSLEERTSGTIKVTYHPQTGEEFIIHDLA